MDTIEIEAKKNAIDSVPMTFKGALKEAVEGGAIEDFKKGKIEIKNDKFGNLQMSIGKVSFDSDSLLQNFDEVIAEVLKSKPASSKGEYIKSVYISSTMGPSIPVDINL